VWPWLNAEFPAGFFNKGVFMKIALFSGRFDPFNLGHIITTGKLLQDYDKVIVCVLDYSGRESCDIESSIWILAEFLRLWACCNRDRVVVVKNKTHFAKITEEEIRVICWNATNISNIDKFTYVGGNEEVNRHISSLDFIKVEYRPRASIHNSTFIRDMINSGKSLDEQYNIRVF